jgi:putative membrane protein
MGWQQEGTEPDYRFSLANERTFLAWIRMALAVLAGAVALHQFATALQPRWLVVGLSTAIALFSALMGAGAYLRWKGSEIAMRHSRPLPPSLLIPVLAGAIALLSLAAALLVVVQ